MEPNFKISECPLQFIRAFANNEANINMEFGVSNVQDNYCISGAAPLFHFNVTF